MSLDTYANLKLELQDWSHRDDLSLKLDTFIDMAETEIYVNDKEPLEARDAETRVTIVTSTTSRFIALPAGFQSARKLRIQIENGESIPIHFRTPEQLNLISVEGIPRFFTVTDQIEFDRISDTVYTGEIQYYKEFTKLSSTNATNFVLDNWPNIYLHGCLWALFLFSEEFEVAGVHYAQFISAIKGANTLTNKGRYGPTPVMRVEGTVS